MKLFFSWSHSTTKCSQQMLYTYTVVQKWLLTRQCFCTTLINSYSNNKEIMQVSRSSQGQSGWTSRMSVGVVGNSMVTVFVVLATTADDGYWLVDNSVSAEVWSDCRLIATACSICSWQHRMQSYKSASTIHCNHTFIHRLTTLLEMGHRIIGHWSRSVRVMSQCARPSVEPEYQTDNGICVSQSSITGSGQVTRSMTSGSGQNFRPSSNSWHHKWRQSITVMYMPTRLLRKYHQRWPRANPVKFPDISRLSRQAGILTITS